MGTHVWTFRLNTVNIDATASNVPQSDTDILAFTAQVGSSSARTIVYRMGEVRRGRYDVGLQLGPFYSSNREDRVAFGVQLVNSGAKDLTRVQTALIKGGLKLLEMSDVPNGSLVPQLTDYFLSAFPGVLPGACDGLVAAGRFSYQEGELWRITRNLGGRWGFRQHFKGDPTPRDGGQWARTSMMFGIRSEVAAVPDLFVTAGAR